MNNQLKQELTRRYLQSLDLSNSLDRTQRAKIIEINGGGEWLIFNASSLSAKKLITSNYDLVLYTNRNGFIIQDGIVTAIHIARYINQEWRALGLKNNSYQLEQEGDRWKVMGVLAGQHKPSHLIHNFPEIDQGFSPESYNVDNLILQNLLLEVIKDQCGGNELEAKLINFFCGGGIDGKKKKPALSVNNEGRGSKNLWIAVKKLAITSNGYDGENIFLNYEHWRKAAKIDDLINCMKSNHAQTRENTQTSTNNNSSSQEFNEIALIISEVEKICNLNKLIIQKGRQLGINLKKIDLEEIDKFGELVNWNVNWYHEDNNEARKIFDNFCKIYEENLIELIKCISLQDKNNLDWVKAQIIKFIRDFLKNSAVQLENDDWETQINNSTNQDQIQQIKNRILATVNIYKEEKSNENELINLIAKGKSCQNEDELIEIINKIEHFSGEKIYELHSDEIQEIKTRLFNQNSSAYSSNINLMIIKEMENKKIVEDELSTEIKSALNKIKNQTINDKQTINEVWKNILDEINQITADKETTNLLREYQQAINSEEKEKIRQKIQSFVIKSGKNKFLSSAYQKQKQQIDNILKNFQIKMTNDLKKDKWLLIIPAIITFLMLILLLITRVIIRREKNSQKEI